MLDLLIATNNPHKVHEYELLFKGYDVKIHTPKELGISVNPDENGTTYEANSLIKAKALAECTTMATIADDSGLGVEALDGFPGIRSARFASSLGGNEKANLELIKKLEPFKNKTSYFTCVITLLNIDTEIHQFKGICKGKILEKPYGEGGFGYDPIFYSDEAKLPFGLASEEIKNKYSHRALAVQKLISYLKDKNLI